MLRDELGRSESVSVGVSDRPRLVNAINRVYSGLADDHDWPHLRKTFDKIKINAGQHLYDFPTDLNYDRVEQTRIWWNATPHPILRGITLDDYVVFDTTANVRSDPVMKWDVRRVVAGKEQVEVWPIPAGAQAMQFIGFIKTPKLINDSDVCLLDDNLVTLYAALRFIKDPKEKQIAMGEAKDKLDTLRSNVHSSDDSIRMGLGSPKPTPYTNVVIRVR